MKIVTLALIVLLPFTALAAGNPKVAFETSKGKLVIELYPDKAPITVNNFVVYVGVIATLFYFYFSKEHKGALGVVSRVGIIFIMVAFGASFGYTVMARISLLIGRFYFLLHDWLPIIR